MHFALRFRVQNAENFGNNAMSIPGKEVSELESQLENQARIAQNLLVANQRLHNLVRSIPAIVMGCDLDGNFYELNGQAEQVFGFNQFEVFEQPLADFIIRPEDREAFASNLSAAVAEPLNSHFELPAVNKDGQVYRMEWHVTPMLGADGNLASLILVCVDVTEQIAQQERLERLANVDPLTLLNNRRGIFGIAETWKDSDTDQLHLIMIDVDHFKSFNDTFGHLAGDEVLKRVGQLLTEFVTDDVAVGRYGGEEFIVLTRNMNLESTADIAEGIRFKVMVGTKDLSRPVTASFGVATLWESDPNVASAVHRADKCLYEAKTSGRNCVVVSQEVEAA